MAEQLDPHRVLPCGCYADAPRGHTCASGGKSWAEIAAEPPFSTGQPVMNKRTGTIVWVAIPGKDTMLVSYADRAGTREVKTANYEAAEGDIPWISTPSTSYGTSYTGVL